MTTDLRERSIDALRAAMAEAVCQGVTVDEVTRLWDRVEADVRDDD